MTLYEYSKEIIKFLKNYLNKSHCKGYAIGISGGIDSALVLALAIKAVGKEKVFPIILPCHSNPLDEKLARKQCKVFNIKPEILKLDSIYDSFELSFKEFSPLIKLSSSNLKVRLRMVSIYAYAQNKSALVIGTDNLDERYLGYFTKYGDGACDLFAINFLVKKEVNELAKKYGVINEILKRKPTAGLIDNQNDEDELQISYCKIDDFLLNRYIDRDSLSRIKYLHKISSHKRGKIPCPPKYERN